MNIIVKPRPRKPSLATVLAEQPAYIDRLRAENTRLRALLREARRHIDVSLINNSKRSTAQWEALAAKLDFELEKP